MLSAVAENGLKRIMEYVTRFIFDCNSLKLSVGHQKDKLEARNDLLLLKISYSFLHVASSRKEIRLRILERMQ